MSHPDQGTACVCVGGGMKYILCPEKVYDMLKIYHLNSDHLILRITYFSMIFRASFKNYKRKLCVSLLLYATCLWTLCLIPQIL